MTQKAKNRGQLIDIARSYLSGNNHVICREDIPQMIDDLISKVKILDIQRVNAPLIADLETQLINATNEILKPGTIGDNWTRLNNKIQRLSSTLNVLNGR